MAWPDLEWNYVWQAAAVVTALLGLVGQFVNERGTRMSRELVGLEQAITSAAQRDDPLQHAYRALALERLHGVHQRDRSRKAGGMALLWGIYGALLFAAAIMSTTMTGQQVFLLSAVVCAYLALRNWARWAWGTRTNEAIANDAYAKALAHSRRQFTEATNNLPDLPPIPRITHETATKLRRVPRAAWQSMLTVAVVAAIAGTAAWLTRPLVADHEAAFQMATRITIMALLVTLGWTSRRRLLRVFDIVQSMVGRHLRWPTVFLLVAITGGVVWWLSGRFVIFMESGSAEDSMSSFGWGFLPFLLAGYNLLFLGWDLQKRRTPNVPRAAPAP